MKSRPVYQLLPILAVAACLASSPARAENGVGRGGGDAFECVEQGVTRVYLADTYEYFSPNGRSYKKFQARLEELQRVAPATIMRAALASLRVSSAAEYEALVDFTAQVERIPDPKFNPEADLKDDKFHKWNIPKGCRKLQLGVQEADGRALRYHPGLYEQLSPAEKVLFFVHEGYILYRLRSEPESLDSRKTRQRVRDLTRRVMEHVFEVARPPYNTPAGAVLYAFLAQERAGAWDQVELLTNGVAVDQDARARIHALLKASRSESMSISSPSALQFGLSNLRGTGLLDIEIACQGAPVRSCYLKQVIDSQTGDVLVTSQSSVPGEHRAPPTLPNFE